MITSRSRRALGEQLSGTRRARPDDFNRARGRHLFPCRSNHDHWPRLAGWPTQEGQPTILLDGLSVWPTVFLRPLTFVLCVLLIFRGYRLMESSPSTSKLPVLWPRGGPNLESHRRPQIGRDPGLFQRGRQPVDYRLNPTSVVPLD